VKIALFVAVAALISSQALAQDDARLATPTGHEVNVSIGGYTYTEPGALSISIDGVKIGGEYTGTLSLSKRRRVFAQADVRGTFGNVTYTGWCSPLFITPNSASPNGYELDFGTASPCSETGDPDWYVEGRVLAGKDFVGSTWAWSPYSGLGIRHLSNGTNGAAGYRTDEYLYVPIGATTRHRVASHGVLSLNLEFDALLHGWQNTRGTLLGGGDIPATRTAPAFTIDGFSDVAFSQTRERSNGDVHSESCHRPRANRVLRAVQHDGRIRCETGIPLLSCHRRATYTAEHAKHAENSQPANLTNEATLC
jgi:hypothetical protein